MQLTKDYAGEAPELILEQENEPPQEGARLRRPTASHRVLQELQIGPPLEGRASRQGQERTSNNQRATARRSPANKIPSLAC